MKLDFIDVKRAYFQADARRDVFVKLPEEDMEQGMCGKLLKSMYGTRDAAQNWEEEYCAFMVSIGFRRGISSPCVFYHEELDIRAVIHGDDFTMLGWNSALDWFRQEISKKFVVKFKAKLGPEPTDGKVVRVLNRLVEWKTDGIYYEADQRHAEIIVKTLQEEIGNVTLNNPGKRIRPEDMTEKDVEELSREDASVYRALSARGNYMAQDRTDVRFAVKEISRHMSKPRNVDWEALIRLGKYLKGRERFVTHYEYQQNTSENSNKFVNVWVDTDFAGCLETRKSTSGGVIMLNNHVIKAWSVTQTVIALSSGEAEYYGLVRGSSMGLGVISMLEDLGISRRLKVKTDASVAKAISARRGVGKIRHIEVSQLWLQDRVNRGDLEVEKVRGEINRADPFTKYKDWAAINKNNEWLTSEVREDRHKEMPILDVKEEELENEDDDW